MASVPRRHRRSWTRRLRKRAVRGVFDAALRLAPRLPDRGVDGLERALVAAARIGPAVCSPLRRLVERRMESVGASRPGAGRAYFVQAARHYLSALHFFRGGVQDGSAGGGDPGRRGACGVGELARQRIVLDESLRLLLEAHAEGRGVVLAASHICQFLLGVARLTQELPITVYLRYSNDATGQRAKEAWCRGAGLSYIAEPDRPADPAARAARLAEALAERRVLLITPDIPQRRGRGIPVRLFDREVSLASGAASLSLLAGAPLVPVTARLACAPGEREPRNCIVMHRPVRPPVAGRGRGWRRRALIDMQQQWAAVFEEFVRRHPQLWLHWLDNRWARVFRSDRRYVGRA